MTDSKKESFRGYLVQSGAVDALTKGLVALYEEADKPQNSIDYVITALGGTTPGEKEQMEEDYKKQIAELQEKLDKALEDVKKLEKTDEPAEGEAAEGGEGEAEPAAE